MNTDELSMKNETEALNKHNVMRCTHTYNFHGGVQVTKDDIERWHKDILASFEKESASEYHHIRSGNGMVIGRRNRETGTIEIFEVSRGYEVYTYEPSEV